MAPVAKRESPVRVHIVLAAYQGETHLPELLRSIRAQSHAGWTLLIRDDGSRDATPRIIRSAAQEDRRIVIVEDGGQRLGAVGNFARLLERAWRDGAGYVLLADQDDVWCADKVARQLAAFETPEPGAESMVPQLVYCDAAVVDAAGRPLHPSFLRQNRLPYASPRPLRTLLGRSFVLGCASAVNRALMEFALPLPEAAASHDWWLALCAAVVGRIVCLDAPLLEYRRHAANASQSAFWNVVGSSPRRWRRRGEIGWTSFLQSLAQAKALHDRLRQRNVDAGEGGEVLEAFCRIVQQPGRWRRVWDLHRLGVPALDWPRRLLFDACLLWLAR